MNMRRTMLSGIGAILGLLAGPVGAADGTWILNANGNWSTTANWMNGIVADGADSTAYFTLDITADRNVNLDTSRTIGHITFTDTVPSHRLTITGAPANVLTLRVSSGSPVINVTQPGRTLQINAALSGTNGLTKSGSGILILNNNANNYTGTTLVSGGILQIGTAWNVGVNSVPGGYTTYPTTGSNLELNDGMVSYFFSFARILGTGDGQIQLTGGTCGFTQKQNDRVDLTFTGPGTELVWGTPTFNPSTLLLNDAGAGPAAPIKLNNGLDLNGTNRTVSVNAGAVASASVAYSAFGRINGALLAYPVRNTSGTPAGLIKTGIGVLGLDGTNTYEGGTFVNQGGVFFNRRLSMPSAGTVAVNDGTALIVSVGGSGQWTTGTSGNGTIGGLLAGLGGQAGSTVSYTGNVTVGFNVDTTQTYAECIGDVGSRLNLAIHSANATGLFDLRGSNTYSGATFVESGRLRLSHDYAVASSTGLIVRGANAIVDANVRLKSLFFDTGAARSVTGTGTLVFASGGAISNSDNRIDCTITVPITGSPAVRIKDWGAANMYQGLIFAPTSGAQRLGAVLNPDNTGNQDKSGITLAGTTTGNEAESIDFAGATNMAR